VFGKLRRRQTRRGVRLQVRGNRRGFFLQFAGALLGESCRERLLGGGRRGAERSEAVLIWFGRCVVGHGVVLLMNVGPQFAVAAGGCAQITDALPDVTAEAQDVIVIVQVWVKFLCHRVSPFFTGSLKRTSRGRRKLSR